MTKYAFIIAALALPLALAQPASAEPRATATAAHHDHMGCPDPASDGDSVPKPRTLISLDNWDETDHDATSPVCRQTLSAKGLPEPTDVLAFIRPAP